MPRKPIDYKNCIIYHFVCNDKAVTDTYVGHTTNFVERKASHKSICNNEKYNSLTKLYKNIRGNGGWANWLMTPLEEYPCESDIQARIREQYWIDALQTKMNNNRAMLSESDKKEYKIKYYSNNKDKITKKVICECGVHYTHNQKARHIKSKPHLKFLIDGVRKSHINVMDVKPQAPNRWVQHIKDFATKNGMSYREAMRSEACKSAYKAPEKLAPLALPEVQEPVMEMPVLERSEPIQPKAVKKIRVKRAPKLVPT